MSVIGKEATTYWSVLIEVGRGYMLRPPDKKPKSPVLFIKFLIFGFNITNAKNRTHQLIHKLGKAQNNFHL